MYNQDVLELYSPRVSRRPRDRSWRTIFCHFDKTNAILAAHALTDDPRSGHLG
jgi:hypothetical protein